MRTEVAAWRMVMPSTRTAYLILNSYISCSYFTYKNITMKKIWKYFFLLLSTSASAQNLVPNPSFEDTVACPTTVDQVYKATGWHSYRPSPDYFNTCADSASLFSVPYNAFGYQYPRTGNAY